MTDGLAAGFTYGDSVSFRMIKAFHILVPIYRFMFLIGAGMQSSFVDYVINELKEIKVFEIDLTQYRLASRFYK